MKRGAYFISLEGPEGSGKSSVLAFLKKLLTQKGLKVAVFREPGSTKVGEKIRQILLDKRNRISPYTELLLYVAARTQLIEEKLKRAFEKYDFILSDRFFDSTLVYQGYAFSLRGVSEDLVKKFSFGIKPDLTLVLDLPVQRGLKRISKKDRIESRPFSFHQKIREGYLKLARRYPERIRVICADRELKEIFLGVKDVLYEQFKFLKDAG